jgi:cob(I)alamin adenosyltransferase
MEKVFNDPKLGINRVYTKQGDAGETHLVGGPSVSKDDIRVEAYGTIDELNAFVGAARATLREHGATLATLDTILKRVQHELFNLGSLVATLPEDVRERQARVTDSDVTQLEKEIDEFNAELAPLRSFVLPGGSRLNADLHVCRTVCRRAERRCVTLLRVGGVAPECVRYLNRLSDAFFVWSRWANHALGAPEILWEPNEAASGREG